MIDVDMILDVSQDEKTLTGGAWFQAPDPYCRLGWVYQPLTFTKVTASTR